MTYLRSSFILLILSVILIGCEEEMEPEVEILPLEMPSEFYVFDYGNTGTSTDILLSLNFPENPESGVEYRLFIVKEFEAGNLTTETAVSMSPDRYAVLDVTERETILQVSTAFLDVDGNTLEENESYFAVLLLADTEIEDRVELSIPSNRLIFTSQPIRSLYSASFQSGEIYSYNPYTMSQTGTVLTGLEGITGLYYSETNQKMYFTGANGIIGSFDPVSPSGTEILATGLNNPGYLAEGPDGYIYVAESNKISRYSLNGTYIDDFASGYFATGFDWGANGDMFVAQSGNGGDIVKYNAGENSPQVLIAGTDLIDNRNLQYDNINNTLFIVKQAVDQFNLYFIARYDLEEDVVDFELPITESIVTTGLVVHNGINQFVMVKNTPRSGSSDWTLTNFDFEFGIEIHKSNRILNEDLVTSISLGPFR